MLNMLMHSNIVIRLVLTKIMRFTVVSQKYYLSEIYDTISMYKIQTVQYKYLDSKYVCSIVWNLYWAMTALVRKNQQLLLVRYQQLLLWPKLSHSWVKSEATTLGGRCWSTHPRTQEVTTVGQGWGVGWSPSRLYTERICLWWEMEWCFVK